MIKRAKERTALTFIILMTMIMMCLCACGSEDSKDSSQTDSSQLIKNDTESAGLVPDTDSKEDSTDEPKQSPTEAVESTTITATVTTTVTTAVTTDEPTTSVTVAPTHTETPAATVTQTPKPTSKPTATSTPVPTPIPKKTDTPVPTKKTSDNGNGFDIINGITVNKLPYSTGGLTITGIIFDAWSASVTVRNDTGSAISRTSTIAYKCYDKNGRHKRARPFNSSKKNR